MSKNRVIRFEAINSGASVMIPATYRNAKGEQISILRNGKVVPGELTSEQRKQRKDIVLKPNMDFTMVLREDKESAIEFDAWSEHILAVVPGARGENLNTNCKNPQFKIIDIHKEVRNKFNNEKLKLAVGNTVNNATIESLYNVLFAIGQFRGGVNKDDILDEDIWLRAKEYAEKNPVEFKKLLERQDFGHLVVINKAIALQILKSDRGRYSYHSTDVGGSPEEAMTYFQQYTEQYQQLRRQVASSDDLSVKFNTETVDTWQVKDEVVPTLTSPASTTAKKK